MKCSGLWPSHYDRQAVISVIPGDKLNSRLDQRPTLELLGFCYIIFIAFHAQTGVKNIDSRPNQRIIYTSHIFMLRLCVRIMRGSVNLSFTFDSWTSSVDCAFSFVIFPQVSRLQLLISLAICQTLFSTRKKNSAALVADSSIVASDIFVFCHARTDIDTPVISLFHVEFCFFLTASAHCL